MTIDLETIARRVATELRDCCADPDALNTDAAEVLVMEALEAVYNGALDAAAAPHEAKAREFEVMRLGVEYGNPFRIHCEDKAGWHREQAHAIHSLKYKD